MPNNTRQACSATLSEKLTEISMAQSECTIYRVHSHLRNVNPKAYEPAVIAIGPYHRDKDDLKMMEDHKLRYLHLLLQSKNENVDKYVSAIRPEESKARRCYAEHIILNATEFVEMLVLDGCFIIELVRKCNVLQWREKNDPIFQMDWIINSLQRDLMLFENQIPYFVLCELFDLIEVPNQHSRLSYLFLSFFSILYPGGKMQRGSVDDSNEIKHLLHFVHRSWLPPRFNVPVVGEDGRDEGKRWRFISNTTRLREANVKFGRKEGVPFFDVGFNNGVMVMAPLIIEDRTDSCFRNLLAYEQYFPGIPNSFMTDYVKLLDCLIDTSKDVEILSHHGIIENWLGDDEVVAKMVNTLVDSVAGPGDHFIYAKIFENVDEHCRRRWNRWMAKLRRNYLSSPWAIISILFAVVLLLLSVTQTLFTILQVL